MRPISLVVLSILASCSKQPGPAPAAEPRVYVSDEDGGAVHVDDDLSEPGAASAMALTVQPGQVEFLV